MFQRYTCDELWHKSRGMFSYVWKPNTLCMISIKAMCLSIRTMSSTVPRKQLSWATWEEVRLPYWVWKRGARSAQAGLYLVRKSVLWRINRAEMFLLEGGEEGEEESSTVMRRDGRWGERRYWRKKTSVQRMSNRAGGCNNCSYQSLRRWEDSRDGSRSKWGDDDKCGTPAAIWVWVCGMLYDVGGRGREGL